MPHVTIPTTDPYILYTATGGQTVFAIPFPFFATADIVVAVNDVVLGVGFTVTGTTVDGGFSSGSVTFSVGRTVSDRVAIYRRTPLQRTTDFPYPSATLNLQSLNTELDRVVALQQEAGQDYARSLRVPDSDPVPAQLPAAAARAGKLLTFDSSGNPAVSTLTLGGTVTVSGYAAQLLDDTTAAEARATLGAVARGGDTMTGDLTINRAWPTVYLNKPASGTASQIFGSANGALRWGLSLGSTDAESGGNAGSTLVINRYSDAGEWLDIPLSISRATGRTTLTDARVGALSVAAAGGEGGEIRLERQPTGSALAADLTLDFAGNALRIFEGGGTVRGAVLDITECAAAVGSKIWHAGNFPFVPRPTGATGVGLWTYIQPGSGAALVLPAGGTWAYFATRRDAVSGAGKDGVGGVAAGGTTVGPAIGGEAWTGFAWRIA